MKKVICGIQQIGIGVHDMREAWKWYREHFGMDIRVFEEEAVADLMLPYTNDTPAKRHAALTINMHGGGGFEIWQHKGKTPEAPMFGLQFGDLGIYSAKLKTHDPHGAYKMLIQNGVEMISDVNTDPSGKKHFFVKDPYNNVFQFVHEKEIFRRHNGHNEHNGGVFGAIIGVEDIDASLGIYRDILEYDEVVYDKTDIFPDLDDLPGGNSLTRRVLLKHSNRRLGPFSRLLGPSEIELVEMKDRKPRRIYEGRIWGDLGFIHICFDVRGMRFLREECNSHGFPFTVDSLESFDMGEAAGHFAYIEDPSGTLIEFVEAHRLPIIKKFGWYMNLRKRHPERPLPNWMVRTMAFGRVRPEDI